MFILKYTLLLPLLIIFIEVYGKPQDDYPIKLVDDLKEPEDPGEDYVEPPPTPPISLLSEVKTISEIITGDADCSCGRPQPKPAARTIVGGELAKINDLPWTVAIVNKAKGLVFCGGTLICDRFILTASHCVQYVYDQSEIMVYLMEQDFAEENENAQPTLRIDVAEIIRHPDYDKRKINNDITLLKLATPVNINDDHPESMTPACLPANNEVSFAGMNAIVAGWGATSYGQNVVSHLRKVTVPIFEQEECRNSTKYKKVLTENMLCAGFLEGQQDACSGDSGGPLVVNQQGQYILCGIVSFGYGCAEARSPGVYARVGRYGDWIRENTKDCQFCKQ